MSYPFARLLAAIREGCRSAVMPEIDALLGRTATSFRTFAEEHADSWR